MPIYRVQAPNGKIYKVEGPENADPNTLFGFVQQQVEAEDIRRLQKEYGPGILQTFGRATKRGFQELGSLGTDIIPAMAGSALGFDEYAKEQMAEAAAKRAAREAEAPTVFRSYKEVEGLGDVPKFVAETIGEQVANIGTALIPGLGLGALATRGVTQAAVKSLAAEAAERGLVGTAAEQFVAQGLKAAAPQIAARTATGQNAGIFLGSYAQNAPEVFQNIYENTGELAPGAGALFGIASAALDSVLPATLAKNLTGPVKAGIVEKVLEKSGMDKGLLRSVTAGTITGIPAEGLTEGAQEAISIFAEKFVADNPQVFESKEWERIMESAVKGAVAGGAFGGLGGAAERGKAASERRQAYADALERRGQRQQAAEVRRQDAEIMAMQDQEAQMALPGMEMGPATGLYRAKEVAKEEPGAPKELKGKQAELFTPEGELTPAMEKAATRDEKIEANKQRLAAQRQAAEVKEAQAKLKKFLASKQATLPGFDAESLDALQAQVADQRKAQAEQLRAAEAMGQADLFAPPATQLGTTTAPVEAQPTTTSTVTPQVQPAPSLETMPTAIGKDSSSLKTFGKMFGIGPTARILREDGPLAGKDISNPEDAAEVKRVLEAYASGKPATGAAEKIDTYLKRPEFQGVTDVTAQPVEQPSGAGAGVVGEPVAGAAPGVTTGVEPSGVVPAPEDVGQPAVGEGAVAAPVTAKPLTERQQRIEFGKALGATQPYPGELKGRVNLPAQKAVMAEDFPGVVAALEGSKNATVAEVAKRAKGLDTKIVIDEEAEERYEAPSAVLDQFSVDGAKMHLGVLEKLRELAPVVEALPNKSPLPYEIRGAKIPAFEKGTQLAVPFTLTDVVKNNHSMFAPLELGESRALNTKEDFNQLLNAYEGLTNELGEDKLRLTSTASMQALGVAGRYDASTNTIRVPEYYAKNESVLAHEIVHAQAVQAVANPTPEQKPIVQRLDRLFAHVKQVLEERAKTDPYFRKPYGVTNTQEFIAEGMSNPDFQYVLSRIRYENTTAWGKFVELVAQLLNLKPDNAFTELLQIYSDLTQRAEPAPAEVAKTPAEPGKKAKTDLAKAERGREESAQQQANFLNEVDENANSLLVSRLRELGRDAGLKDADLPAENYRGTEAHNILRLPYLFAQHNDSMEMLRESVGTPQEQKNRDQIQQIEEAIARSGPEAVQVFQQLQGMSPKQQTAYISEINRVGRQMFDEYAQNFVSKTKAEQTEKPEAKLKKAEPTEAELDAMVEDFNKKFFEKTGRKLFSPSYQGPAFDADQQRLAQAGDVNGLLRNLIDKTSNPVIKQILRRIRSLNLNTRVVIAPVEGGQAGSYDPATNTITLDPTNGLNAHTFIHEVVHAAISNVLANSSHPLTKAFQQFFIQIQDRLGAAYGAQDLQEFAAELVGNPEFQAILRSIKAPRSESLFRRIMETIAEFFGFKGKSAFDQGVNFINDAINISGDVEPVASQKMFLGTGAFPAVGRIGQSMPSLTGAAVDRTKNFFSNIKDVGALQAGLGMLRLDNLNTIYRKELPSLQKLIDALEKRNGTQEQRIKTVNENYKRFTDVQKKFPQAMERMGDMAIDARLAEVDLLNPNFQPTNANLAEYNRLQQIYRSLPKEVQDVYRTMRKDYDRSLGEYRNILLQTVSPSLAQKLSMEFQNLKGVTGYVPFLRHGDFWVEYADPQTGERAASAFESTRERQQFIDTVLTPQRIQHRAYQNLQSISYDAQGIPPTSFIGRVMSDLQKQGADQSQLDSVYQAYLTLFPGESILKQFMKAKNVRGMERDMVRNYGDIMVRWSRKLANSEYMPQINKALGEIAVQGERSGSLQVEEAAKGVLRQGDFFRNPTYGSMVNAAVQFSYFEYIAGNISSALINVTSLPMLVWPLLSGKFGFGETSSAMMAASRTIINGLDKNPRYKNLYQTLMDHGQLEHTISREVLEGRRQTTGQYFSLYGKMMDALSIPFSATERYNRGVTAVAAYDLAKGRGMSEEKAIRYALDTVKDIHTSGMAATAPRWMQHPVGRVFFTFKSFVWNSAFVVARAFYNAYKGETPEVRRAAQRQLIGMYGMTMAFAGVKGMPFYGAASTLATMLNAMFGDDEPFDFDEEMRRFFGELFYKGFFNYITNIELANRAGIATDLIYRDDPRGVAEHGYVLSAMQQAFGPLGSYLVNAERGINAMADGQVMRGVESLLPSWLRNGLKGARYMTEGATTLKGDPVVEDVSAYNSLMQVIGFAPANLSTTYEKLSAAKAYEREINSKRAKLLDRYNMANEAGDFDMREETKAMIREFNEVFPAKKITQETLAKSVAGRKAAEKQMINGVRFDKKLMPEIQEKFFSDEEEE